MLRYINHGRVVLSFCWSFEAATDFSRCPQENQELQAEVDRLRDEASHVNTTIAKVLIAAWHHLRKPRRAILCFV